MTDEELEAIEKACAEATPGPWVVGGSDTYTCVHTDVTNVAILVHNKDAHIIANSRSWLPAIVAEVRRVRAEEREACAQLADEECICGAGCPGVFIRRRGETK